jgi:hypothetical protein
MNNHWGADDDLPPIKGQLRGKKEIKNPEVKSELTF